MVACKQKIFVFRDNHGQKLFPSMIVGLAKIYANTSKDVDVKIKRFIVAQVKVPEEYQIQILFLFTVRMKRNMFECCTMVRL